MAAASGNAAPLIEIFASIQGEGRFIGVPMTFVRTARCPIRCRYCDTPHGFEVPDAFEVRGPGEVRSVPNPIVAADAAQLAGECAPRPPAEHLVSVTGGEPLVHADFVGELAAALHAGGARVHLETAALHPAALRRVAPHLDHLSADYKLPATLEQGDFRAQHRECVAIGVDAGLTVDVKIVLTPGVEERAVGDALDHLAELRSAVMLILQPVTPFGAVSERPPVEAVTRALQLALERGFAVRVLPQLHPVLGVD